MLKRNLILYLVACYNKLFFLEVTKKSFFGGNFDIFIIWSLNGEFLTFSKFLGLFLGQHEPTSKLVALLFYTGSMLKADKINKKIILHPGINNKGKITFFDVILTSKNFQKLFLDIFFHRKLSYQPSSVIR